jgi:hypothetical protein
MFAENCDVQSSLRDCDVFVIGFQAPWSVESCGILDVKEHIVQALSPLECRCQNLNILL